MYCDWHVNEALLNGFHLPVDCIQIPVDALIQIPHSLHIRHIIAVVAGAMFAIEVTAAILNSGREVICKFCFIYFIFTSYNLNQTIITEILPSITKR